MTVVTKFARLAYIVVAFLGSWLTSPVSPMVPGVIVHAAVLQDRDNEFSDRFSQGDVIQRLRYLEGRVNDQGDSLANMRGIGSGALAVLGVLQIVGILGAKKKESD